MTDLLKVEGLHHSRTRVKKKKRGKKTPLLFFHGRVAAIILGYGFKKENSSMQSVPAHLPSAPLHSGFSSQLSHSAGLRYEGRSDSAGFAPGDVFC